MIAPGLVYRFAGWLRPPGVGDGRLVVRLQGRGSARLRYFVADGEGRAECVRRQAWLLRVPAAHGASRAALREEGCVADGDNACEYVVTWTDDARVLPAVLAGLVTAGVLSSTAHPMVWVLSPVAAMATHTVERWRIARANPVSIAQSGAAFRWLVGRALTESISGPTEAPAALPSPSDRGASIEKEGDVWRIAYEGKTVRLRHARGLALLAHLVRSPGQEIHVTSLDAITPSGGSATPRGGRSPDDGVIHMPGDAGEVLDAQARSEYRRRIVELRGELADAETRADLGHAEAMRAELERLEDELSLAVGPRGRPRRAAADDERLRGAISHRIRSAIAQIERHHPALGRHLTASVSTGYRCVYEPMPAGDRTSGRRNTKA